MDAARIDSLITQDPRVMAAGWWGSQIYIHLLLLNAAHTFRGFVPARFAAPEYLARFIGLEAAPYLQISGADIVRVGLTAASQASLLAIEPLGVRLIHREHWESASAPRVRKMREKRRDKLAQRREAYSVADRITCSEMEQVEGASQDAKCGPIEAGGQSDGGQWSEAAQTRSQSVLEGDQGQNLARGSGIQPIAMPNWFDQLGKFPSNAQSVTGPFSSHPPSSSSPSSSPLSSPSQTLPLLSPQQLPLHLASPTRVPRDLSTDLSTGEVDPDDWSDLEEAGLTSGDLELPIDPQWLGQKATIMPTRAPQTKATDRVVSRDAVLQAEMLASVIIRRHPKSRVAQAIGASRSIIIARWSTPIERLHRIDRIPWHEISATIEWIGRSEFWGGVILSAGNLREKWDTIQAQRARSGSTRASTPTKGRFEAAQGIHRDGEQKL